MKKLFLLALVSIACITAQSQADSLKQYAGKYTFPEGSPVTEVSIAAENNTLMATSAMGTSEFKATSEADVFEVVAYSGTATFRRKDGKIVGLQIVVGSTVMEGTKSENQYKNADCHDCHDKL